LAALPRTVLYAFTMTGRPEFLPRSSVIASSASHASSSRLAS